MDCFVKNLKQYPDPVVVCLNLFLAIKGSCQVLTFSIISAFVFSGRHEIYKRKTCCFNGICQKSRTPVPEQPPYSKDERFFCNYSTITRPVRCCLLRDIVF